MVAFSERGARSVSGHEVKMGRALVDEYTLLHVASGIMAFYWGVPLRYWMTGHTAFELLENTEAGMHVINKWTMWPGGKDFADTPLNSLVGDTAGALLGWLVAESFVRGMGGVHPTPPVVSS